MLFIAGFGSSAVFGTLTGELADRYGRRLACLVPTPSNVYNYTYTTHMQYVYNYVYTYTYTTVCTTHVTMYETIPWPADPVGQSWPRQ